MLVLLCYTEGVIFCYKTTHCLLPAQVLYTHTGKSAVSIPTEKEYNMYKRNVYLMSVLSVAVVLTFHHPSSAQVTSLTPVWQTQPSGTTNSLNDVYFYNANEGWITGADTLLKTTNGGLTWLAVNSGVDPTSGHNSVRFLDQNIGWVGGLRSVIRTVDAGSNWEGVQYSASLDPDTFRNALFPVSPNVAWAVGAKAIITEFSAETSIAHWRYTFQSDGSIVEDAWYNRNDAKHFGDLLTDVCFVDPNNGWSVGIGGRITHITNANSSLPVFTDQTFDEKLALNGIQMFNEKVGWIVGTDGVILKTVNGGNTWTPQTSGTVMDLYDAFFINLSTGWIVGKNGTILRTFDGGVTWLPELSGITTTLMSVFFVAATKGYKGYAVGYDGTIVTTSVPPFIYVSFIKR
jgi:photosystem II stability/assembly factor-like uncharacterized protein